MRAVRKWPYLLQRTLLASFDDRCFTIAKGAAYSALLSFIPVLTSAATILVQTRADFVRRTLAQFLEEVVPPGSEQLVVDQFRFRGQRPAAILVIAGLLSLWAASSVVKSLMEGFHAAYRTPRSRSFLRETGVAIMLVFLTALPLIGASALILFGGQVEEVVLRALKVDPLLNPLEGVWEWISRIARYAVAFGTTVLITATLYYFGPYRRQRWSAVWPGAVVATFLWILATMGFGWYVRNVSRYNVLYGSVGTSIALLTWMYLMAAIAILGCEFNAEYERLAALQARP